MQRAPQFVTGNFVPHHKFLEDAEYGRALDALVKAVSDVLVVSPDDSQVFLGRRKVEPQPDWWYIGGRAKPGETPEQAAVRNIRRELGLELPIERFEVIANYSFVWHTRAQAPVDNGTADISTVHSLVLRPEEVGVVKLDEKEYLDAKWFAAEEVLSGEFHPALKQAIRDLRAKRAYEALEALAGDDGVATDDAKLAQLAKELVKQVSAGRTAGPVHALFNQETRRYSVSAPSRHDAARSRSPRRPASAASA
mmetsp:Transcript_168385/g.540981  ORF Transcript_168385/g.540981 Transcript_168385/m.540981 type:complete len:252 (+) Transcript_168385:42-797(+)